MSKVMVIGDLHLSSTPPGRRNETYLPELWAMLDEIGAMLSLGDDMPVVFVGDVLHHKRANRVPYWLVLQLMEKLRYWPNIYIVPGNHDLADGSLESLERQPLSMLAWLDNVTLVTDPAVLHHICCEGESCYTLRGIPGTADVTEARDEAKTLFAGPCDLLVAHAPISLTPLPWKTWHPDELPLEGVRNFIYGHQHDEARLVVGDARTSGLNVWAAGCLARGSIREADHTPSVLVVDLEEGGLGSEVRLLTAALPSTEIYRWAEREAEQAENTAMTTFIAALGTAQLRGFSKEALIDEIKVRTDLEEATRALAVEILEDA